MHIKERDIVTSPPNINVSSNEFTMGEGGIYYGLQSVKYVGEKASRHVVMERLLHGNFSSIDDFRSRIPKTILNSRAMEMLVNVGAFDSIDNTRATMDYSEKLKFEYEGLGMYISGHPLDQFKDPVAINIVEIKPDMNGRIVKLITYVTGIHKHTTKNKKKMAFLTCADSHDTLVDVVVFPEVWKKCGADIEKGSIYEVVGK
jgi:DNA polymerase-3 subunit alpha